MNEERLMVLKMLKEGKVTVEEADALLDALATAGPAPAAAEAALTPATVFPGPAAPPPAGRSSLGEEIRRVVREALEGVRAGETIGRSMREMGQTLREEWKDAAGDIDRSLHGMVRGLFGLTSADEEVEVAYPAPVGGRVVVRNRRGDVRVGRATGGEVRVRAAKRVWGESVEGARELLGRLEIRGVPAGRELVIEPVVVGGLSLRYRVDLTVDIPEGIGAHVEVKSGDVRADDVRADLEVRVASGDVAVGAQRGRIHAAVKSGDVEIAEADGLEVEIQSGDLEVGKVRGAAGIRVGSGDVSVEEVRGDLDCAVQSGDLEVAVADAGQVRARVLSGDAEVRLVSLAPGARVGVEVVAGDAEIRLAPAVRAALRGSTTAGDIDVSLGLEGLQRSRGRVEGIYGGAEATVEIRVVSGDLSIGAA